MTVQRIVLGAAGSLVLLSLALSVAANSKSLY